MPRNTSGIPCHAAIEMNFVKYRLHFLAVLAACLTLISAPATATDLSRISLEIDGTSRRFHFYAPPSLDAPAPLMIVLHGSGSTGPGLLAEGKWRDKADREGFVLAAPDSLISYDGVDPKRELRLRDRARQIYRRWRGIDIGRWEGGPNDLKLIATLIDRMDSDARIDRNRIYVASPCTENCEVRYVVGGGVDHLWPPSFTDITWEFLSRFRRTD